MTTGGKRLKELIRKRGFRIKAVAEAIGVHRDTIGAWTDNAPIGKLYEIAKFINRPIAEVIECFNPDRSDPANETIDNN
jgi:transcriptional regulator with XRE-family HTH domain